MPLSLRLDPTNQSTKMDFFTPLSEITSQPKYINAYSDAFLEGSKYSGHGVGIGPYGKQGLSSDVRHTLGSAAGKEAIIDWSSANLGIDPYGKFANVIGNVGITGATALEEIPDAWRSFKQALEEKDYGAITSGGIFAQPWEDVQANLNAWGIPYGATLEQKKSYVPQVRFKQQQLMNKKKQNFQDIVRRQEARLKRLEKLGRDKDRGGFDPSGPTQKSIRRRREDKSGHGHIGGFTDPGKGSYGPHKAYGGRVSYFDGGLLSLWPR